MNFIFPMGGLSSRFTNAGYKVPKYQLDLHGATVFEHSVIGFHRYFADHNFVFAFRGGEKTAKFITEKCKKMGIPAGNMKLVSLDGVTSGQAETVRLAIDGANISADDPIIIFNIDTFQSDYVLPELCDNIAVGGYLEVFKANGDHWSFVEPGSDKRVSRVTEKERISEYCSSGLYYFRRSLDFCRAYDRTLAANIGDLQGGERYVAPLYNDLITRGIDIRYHLVPPEKLTFCGTPAEYDLAIRNPKLSLMSGNARNRNAPIAKPSSGN